MGNPTDIFLPFEVRGAIVNHMNESPAEVCGIITQDTPANFKYVPCDNVHPDPMRHFLFGPTINAKIIADERVVAYVHSHPEGPLFPSKYDMEIQAQVGKASVVVCRDPKTKVMDMFSFGDHVLDYPLIGREFRSCVTDCFEALRAWVWQKQKIYTKPFPREDAWWDHSRGEEWVKATETSTRNTSRNTVMKK